MKVLYKKNRRADLKNISTYFFRLFGIVFS